VKKVNTKKDILEKAQQHLEVIKVKYLSLTNETLSDARKAWIKNIEIVDLEYVDLRERLLLFKSDTHYVFQLCPVTVGRFWSHLYKLNDVFLSKSWINAISLDFDSNHPLLYSYQQNIKIEYTSTFFTENELDFMHLFCFDLIFLLNEYSLIHSSVKYKASAN